MVRLGRIVRWTTRLHAAAAAQDWAALDATDRELAEMLPILAVQGPWSTEERAALLGLDLAHRQARARCATACDALQEQMNKVGTQKDGWLAYALNSSPDESRP
ncbi:MAG: hypothetical protein JWP29_1106 [Rhodoferax sp.]|nr:hypothetical protein [Rhodoferax sp.]